MFCVLILPLRTYHYTYIHFFPTFLDFYVCFLINVCIGDLVVGFLLFNGFILFSLGFFFCRKFAVCYFVANRFLFVIFFFLFRLGFNW